MAHLFHESVIKPRQKLAMGGDRQKSGPNLRERLLEAVGAILADARGALSAPDLGEAARVHQVRKTFKRWRALLRLLEGSPAASAKELRVEARDLMRELSAARDRQCALDALDDLAKAKALAPAALIGMRARLASSLGAAEASALTIDLRERIADYLDRALHAVDSWRLSDRSAAGIADAIRRNYRRARRLVPKNWRVADPARLHELRRRVVEHQHQIELIAPLSPRLVQDRGRELQRLRNRLGACQDLIVLAHLAAPHQPLARWRARLIPAIEARRATHLRTAARLARDLFAEKPKGFRKRLSILQK